MYFQWTWLITLLTLVNEYWKDNRKLGVITLEESIDLPIFAVGGTDERCHRLEILNTVSKYVFFEEFCFCAHP